jgi:aryl-alcohol dehydrogenase-like predicted oxidoreductase
VEDLILPLAAELGLGVLVMRPFAEGALTQRVPDAFSEQRYSEWGIRTWGQALLAWVLADRRCTAALPATRRVERAQENADIGSCTWPDEATRADIAALAQTV